MQKELLINEHILQLSGKANLPQPLKENCSYMINAEIDIKDIIHKNRQDGTKDLIYKGKSTGIVQIQNQRNKEEVFFAKDTRTASQKLRFAIELYHQNHNGEPDYEFIYPNSEEFYQRTMNKIMADISNIIRLIH